MGAKIEALLGLSCLSPQPRSALPAGHQPKLASHSFYPAAAHKGHPAPSPAP